MKIFHHTYHIAHRIAIFQLLIERVLRVFQPSVLTVVSLMIHLLESVLMFLEKFLPATNCIPYAGINPSSAASFFSTTFSGCNEAPSKTAAFW
jgi:hypothetical protein